LNISDIWTELYHFEAQLQRFSRKFCFISHNFWIKVQFNYCMAPPLNWNIENHYYGAFIFHFVWWILKRTNFAHCYGRSYFGKTWKLPLLSRNGPGSKILDPGQVSHLCVWKISPKSPKFWIKKNLIGSGQKISTGQRQVVLLVSVGQKIAGVGSGQDPSLVVWTKQELIKYSFVK